MRLILIIFINVLVVGLFLYSKLLPYKDQLNKQNRGIFNFFYAIFHAVLNFLKPIFKPFEVGNGLSIDVSQIVLLVLLLILLNVL